MANQLLCRSSSHGTAFVCAADRPVHQQPCSISARSSSMRAPNARRYRLSKGQTQHVTVAHASCSQLDPPTTVKSVQYYKREPTPWSAVEELPIKQHDTLQQPYVDLIVAGAGPSGVAVAERVAAAGYSVCIVDPAPLSAWPNNYGTWVDEFTALGLEDCLEIVWPQATVMLDNGPNGEKALTRPYGRVDRPALKRKLIQRCIDHGVTFVTAKAESVSHASGCSTLRLSDGSSLQAALVLDATGHTRQLVQYDKPFNPGYQGAYGIMAEVESHPFDLQKLLFMDWRDDHTMNHPEMQRAQLDRPTFLYAMPFSKTKIFLEETQLVGQPVMEFPELQARLAARLQWLGIKVTRVEEEEYCVIPMGGVLPKQPQRVLGVGGTAGMVHPSTGFMLSRMLGRVPDTADAIVEQLSRCGGGTPTADGTAVQSQPPRRPSGEAEADAMAAAVWAAAWPPERRRQRAFSTAGMGVLLGLDHSGVHDFFAAFFALPEEQWRGFLSDRLTFPQLLAFGLSLFLTGNKQTRANLVKLGFPGALRMLLELIEIGFKS